MTQYEEKRHWTVLVCRKSKTATTRLQSCQKPLSPPSASPPLQHTPVRFPSGLDVWYLLHVQSQVGGQNSPLDHLQSGLILVQREAAQDLVSLESETNRGLGIIVLNTGSVIATSSTCLQCWLAHELTHYSSPFPSGVLQRVCLH